MVIVGRFTCGFFDRDGCIDVRFADDECHRTGQQTREQTGEEATQQQLDKNFRTGSPVRPARSAEYRSVTREAQEVTAVVHQFVHEHAVREIAPWSNPTR